MFDMQAIDLWQQLTVIINAALAAVLGSIIGWERDRAGKSAGPVRLRVDMGVDLGEGLGLLYTN